jgi:branched-chain amino acid transport system ATP-binding protein
LLEIIRAVILSHKLLLLDEPTAGLNPAAKERVAELLGEIRRRGDTVVVIEHDLGFVHAVSDRIFRLEDGELTELR